MPRIVIDLPYVPEADQIAEIIKQQVTQTLPGATVQIVDTSPTPGAEARGLNPASPTQTPLTQQPRQPTPQMGPPTPQMGPPNPQMGRRMGPPPPQGAMRRPMPSPGPMGPTQRRPGPALA
jgi:hypothetical protein